MYFAAIALQCLHLTISILPHLGQGNLAVPSVLVILVLHDEQHSSVTIYFGIGFLFKKPSFLLSILLV